MTDTHFTGTVVSKNGFVSGADSIVPIFASLSLTEEEHAGKTILLNIASGATVTLPPATGSGAIYYFLINTRVTSNNYVISTSGTLRGDVTLGKNSDNTSKVYQTGASTNTITLNGTTKGGLVGGRLFFRDILPQVFAIEVFTFATGSLATPLS